MPTPLPACSERITSRSCCGTDRERTTNRSCCGTDRLPTPVSRLESPIKSPALPIESAELGSLCFEDVLEEVFARAKTSLLIAHRSDFSGREVRMATASTQPPATGVSLSATTADRATLCQMQLQLQEELASTVTLVKTASDNLQALESEFADLPQRRHEPQDATLPATLSTPSQQLALTATSPYNSELPNLRQQGCNQDNANVSPLFSPQAQASACLGETDTFSGKGEEDVHRSQNFPHPEVLREASQAKPGMSRACATYTTSLNTYAGPQNWKLLVLDIVPALAIIANALVIGISSDISPDHVLWEGLEIFFTVFFTIEFCINLRIRGVRAYFVGEAFYWNWFDVLCLITAVIDVTVTYVSRLTFSRESADIGGLMVVKMLRLARLMRLVRLLRFPIFAELKMIVRGVFSGMRVLGWAIILLTFVILVLGIVYRQLVGDKEVEFSTVPSSMFALFRCFTDGCNAYDGTPLAEKLRSNYGASFTLGYSLIYLFVTFGIFNLIMAVFIENVTSQAHLRKLREIGENSRLTREYVNQVLTSLEAGEPENKLKAFVQQKLNRLTKRYSCQEGLQITRKQFNMWLQKPETLQMLEDIDVETATKYELFDVLDINMDGTLSRHEVVDGLMRLRGVVTKTDIVAIRMKVQYITTVIESLDTIGLRKAKTLADVDRKC